MGKGLLALFALGSLLVFGTASSEDSFSQKRSNPPSAPYSEGEVLLKLKRDASLAYADAGTIADQLLPLRHRGGEKISGELHHSDGLYVMNLAEGLSVEDAVSLLSVDPRVEYAEPNYLVYTQKKPDDPFFEEMWGLFNDGVIGKAGADIGATDAWELTTGSDDVVVAVVDTGVDLSHPDLAFNAWVNPREIANNGLDDDGNGLVDDVNGWNFLNNNNQLVEGSSDFHGTHVAGIIGAVGNNGVGITGVAWQVKLMSLKFIGSGSGRTSDAVRAINYAVDQRRSGVNVRVINASWGGPGESTSLRDAIRNAGDAGIAFVCAAGNGGSDNVGDDLDLVSDFPSSWSSQVPSIISVAALDTLDQLPRFSNFGYKRVLVGAPGVRILSTTAGSGGSFAFASGTSMATPHVSGIAVLLWSLEPGLSPVEVKQRIVSTSEPVISLASKVSSSGRASAINALNNTIPPIPPLEVGTVIANEKIIFVDGLGMVNNRTVVEVNGVNQAKKTNFKAAFRLANGSMTRLKAKLGKNRMNQFLPLGVPVTITLFDPVTGERSEPVTFVRN